jgi:hypothetical protein
VSGWRAHLAEVDGLLYGAGREADALGIGWIGPDEFLLALLAANDRSPALIALEDCGIRHDEFADAVKRSIDEADPPVDDSRDDGGRTLNPAAHELIGRAEGVAAGLGASAVSREHVLIAYLWDTSSDELEMLCGVTREEVMERLRSLGVQTPSGPLPPFPVRRPQTKVFVPYADLMPVVSALTARLPRDASFGFNEDGKSRAWVSADSEIDLQGEVAAVLRELGIQPEGSFGEPDA